MVDSLQVTEASIRSRLILLGGITLLVLTVLFGVDRGLKAYYYSQTYRYYEAGEVYYEDEKTLLLYSPHRTLFWLLKPHITMRIEEAPDQYDAYTIGTRPGHYSFEVRSNADGLNSPSVDLAKPEGTVRIVTLGDSRTMAEGVPVEQIYPTVLNDLLRDADPGTKYEVINGGIAGYSSHQGRVLLEETLLAYQPDYVTVLFGINDQDRDQGVSDRAKAVLYDNWVTSLREISNRSMLVYFLRRQVAQARGWMFGKTPMKPVVYEPGQATRRVSFAEYHENLSAIAKLGAEHGFEPIFLIVPTSPYAYYPSLFQKSTSDLNAREHHLAGKALQAMENGDYGLTVGLSQQVLESNPQANPVRRMLAVALQHEGRFQEAHEEFLRLNEGILFSQYENVVRWVSEEAKVRLVDLTPEFTQLRKGTLYVDDMHPNAEGQAIIARRLFEELRP